MNKTGNWLQDHLNDIVARVQAGVPVDTARETEVLRALFMTEIDRIQEGSR